MEEKEKEQSEIKEDKEDKLSRKEKNKIEKLEAELAKAKKEAEEWKNKYYMAYADTQNTKKLYDKEHAEMIKYRAAGFIENLMPALDSFHCALQIKPEDTKMQNFLTGFEYIYKNIISALESEGVMKLEPKINDKFDASYMHALSSEESEQEPNTIVKVLSAGYKLKDRVIRPAMVVVARKKEVKANESINENKENNSPKD